MIRLTYEEKQKNKELRHEIIEKIMEIENVKVLEALCLIAEKALIKEYQEHALTIDDAIGMLDMGIVYKLYEMICKEKETDFASDQIKEICEYEINRHIQYGGSISELKGMQEA